MSDQSHCPICGHWARLKPCCPRCGVDLDRSSTERKDDQLQQARHAIAFAQKELADYRLRIAHALGMYYGADGHADQPCSDDEAVGEIERLKRDAAKEYNAYYVRDCLLDLAEELDGILQRVEPLKDSDRE